MKKKTKTIVNIIILLCIFSSCNKKNTENTEHEIVFQNYADIFKERNQGTPEMVYPIEYYQSKIIEFQKIIPERRRINVIKKIDNIIPGLLCFLVGWDDFDVGRGEGFDIITSAPPRGNLFGLYTFDKNQNIVNEYLVGYKNYLDSIRNILLEKLPGNKFEYGLISFGDFNQDGINEIVSIYLHPPSFEYVFTVFGFDVMENDFIPALLVPVYINFEQPFPPVEYIGNGFRILEVLEYEPLELAWNNYIWDKNTAKYIKE